MYRSLVLLGFATFSWALLNGGASAKLVYYEVDGKRYSYSTNNRAQTLEAMRRIEAAKAAETGKSPFVVAAPVADSTAKTEDASPPPRRERRVARPERPKTPRIQEASAGETSAAAALLAASTPAVAEPLVVQYRARKVRSISFDVETGIKTTLMVDGTAEEEPFDSGTLRHLMPDHDGTSSLAAFVNQLRRTAPEEATGSIRPRSARAVMPPR